MAKLSLVRYGKEANRKRQNCLMQIGKTYFNGLQAMVNDGTVGVEMPTIHEPARLSTSCLRVVFDVAERNQAH